MQPTVVLVAGARPNFVKAAALLRALDAAGRPLEPLLVHTGQHSDDGMSGAFFRDLGIPDPAVRLGVGPAATGERTGRMAAAAAAWMAALPGRPRGVVVVGDVDSTLAGALAARSLGLPLAHVEAGLRSFDRTMPEEVNRVVADALSGLLFATEEAGRVNLLAEGVPDAWIRVTGEVLADVALRELPAARAAGVTAAEGLEGRAYALATLHRPANVDDPRRLADLVAFLVGVSERLPVVFPVHPRTRRRLEEAALLEALEGRPGLRLRPPLGYLEHLGLVVDAAVVLTDSGGLQAETSALGVPCLTLRGTTERPSTVEHGTNTVAGDLALASAALDEVLAGRGKRGGAVPGLDGHASERIVAALAEAWA